MKEMSPIYNMTLRVANKEYFQKEIFFYLDQWPHNIIPLLLKNYRV